MLNLHRYKVLRQQQSEPATANCRQLLQTAQKRRMMFAAAAAGSSKSASLELERADTAAAADAADSEHRYISKFAGQLYRIQSLKKIFFQLSTSEPTVQPYLFLPQLHTYTLAIAFTVP